VQTPEVMFGEFGRRAAACDPLLAAKSFSERDPKFSPDGRWIAYTSDESGRDEVYVQPFPGPGYDGNSIVMPWMNSRPRGPWSRQGM
jgi:hypothetical protein